MKAIEREKEQKNDEVVIVNEESSISHSKLLPHHLNIGSAYTD